MARMNSKSLALQLAEAQAEAEAAIEKFENLKALARSSYSVGKVVEKHGDSTITIEVQPNRFWDKDKARENYGDDICTMQVDQKLAKRKMTGDEYEAYYVDRGNNKIIVKVV